MMNKIWENKLLRADLLLLLLFIAYCGAVILRVNIEGTGYTSPDSEYYLEAARSLRDGERFVIRDLYSPRVDEPGYRIHFTAWPIGYPTLIYAASWISGLDLFWASKAVNLFFAGLGFLLLRRINREYSFILASVYGSFTIIEMYSYTWSECIFMFWSLCLCYILYKIHQTESMRVSSGILLCLTLCAMFLTRYITIYAFLATFAYTLYLYWHKRYRVANTMLIALCFAGSFSFGYLLRNYSLVGHFTGIPRIHTDMETPLQVVWMAIKALIIELFVIKNYYLKGKPDALTIITFMVQVLVAGYVWFLLKKQRALVVNSFKNTTLSHVAIFFAITYLIVLVFLRSISQFDPINYRLLSPFTYLVFFGVIHYVVSLPDHIEGARRAKYALGLFFFASLVLNLPKKFLLSYFL